MENLWFEWSCSIDNLYQLVLITVFHDGDTPNERVNSQHCKDAIVLMQPLAASMLDIINTQINNDSCSTRDEIAVA